MESPPAGKHHLTTVMSFGTNLGRQDGLQERQELNVSESSSASQSWEKFANIFWALDLLGTVGICCAVSLTLCGAVAGLSLCLRKQQAASRSCRGAMLALVLPPRLASAESSHFFAPNFHTPVRAAD